MSSYSLEREDHHIQMMDELCEAYGFACHSDCYRFMTRQKYLELKAKEREATPATSIGAAENFGPCEGAGLATYENGPASDDPPGETPNDPPPENWTPLTAEELRDLEEDEDPQHELYLDDLFTRYFAGELTSPNDYGWCVGEHADALELWGDDTHATWAPLLAWITAKACEILGEWETGELLHKYNQRNQLTTDHAKRYRFLHDHAHRALIEKLHRESEERRAPKKTEAPTKTKWEKRLEELAQAREHCTIYSDTFGRNILLTREHSATVAQLQEKWKQEDRDEVRRE